MTKKEEIIKKDLIWLARTNQRGYPFSACIVYNGKDYYATNEVTRLHDPTAHAEIQAIRLACKKEKTSSLEGAKIYCSGETCPMCLTAIAWAKIKDIYYINDYTIAISNNYYYDRPSKEVNKFLKLNRNITKLKKEE